MALFIINVTIFSGKIFTERVTPKLRIQKQPCLLLIMATICKRNRSNFGYSSFLQQHETEMTIVLIHIRSTFPAVMSFPVISFFFVFLKECLRVMVYGFMQN
jgi:hypothetical protein